MHFSITQKKLEDAQNTSRGFTFGWSVLKALLMLGIAGTYHTFLF